MLILNIELIKLSFKYNRDLRRNVCVYERATYIHAERERDERKSEKELNPYFHRKKSIYAA